MTGTGRSSRSGGRIRAFDVFAAVNVALLTGTSLHAYARPEWEFGFFALVVLVVIVAIWVYFRRYEYPVWLLILLQIGVLSHFAGGFLEFGPDDLELYWHFVLGIRYDKIVHFYNSMAVAMLLMHLLRGAGLELRRFEAAIVVMVTLGLGAVIEIVEYFGVATIPNTSVGDYANNIEDLMMNFLGGATGVTLVTALRGATRRRAAVGPPS